MDVSNRELDLKWYVIRGRVRLADAALDRAGFADAGDPKEKRKDASCKRFVPWQVVRNNRRGAQRKTHIVPLFGVYLFVKIDLRLHNWRRLLDIPGVLGVLCDGDETEERTMPVAVPDAFVDWLISEGKMTTERLQELGLRARKEARKPKIKAGDVVRLVDDVFSSQLLQVEGVDEKGRASLLMRIMGRLVPVKSHISLLELTSVAASVSAGQSE